MIRSLKGYVGFLFSYYTKEYLIKSYLIGFLWLFLYFKGDVNNSFLMYIIILIDSILYPFAKGSYLKTKEFFLGDTFFVANILVFYFAKMAVSMVIMVFAIPLAIIDFILIYLNYCKCSIKPIKKDISDEIVVLNTDK